MLRAVPIMYFESPVELLAAAHRDALRFFRSRGGAAAAAGAAVAAAAAAGAAAAAALPAQQPKKLRKYKTTVLSAAPRAAAPAPPPAPPRPPRSSPSPPPPPRRRWALAAAAAAASLGGIYLYRKGNDTDTRVIDRLKPSEAGEVGRDVDAAGGALEPGEARAFPARVNFLLVGGGTASFAALRAIRSARPEARVLVVAAEGELPYMRPPLSKELWRDADLADLALLADRAPGPRTRLDTLTFRQWNGKRRSVVYEPSAFYTRVEQLGESAGGAAVARGWRVTRLDVARREAELQPAGAGAEGESVVVRYDECLLATGVRAAREPALAAAARAGRSLALHTARDAGRLAAALRELHARRGRDGAVAVLGGGLLATEISAALALAGERVVQVTREWAPLVSLLPSYLAREAARQLRTAGVRQCAGGELQAAALRDERVTLQLADGRNETADLVLECVGAEPDTELARAAGLELDDRHGGVLVNAELQARAHVYAAGDVACFHDVALGRRRVEHHDHAVLSGRLAGENMATPHAPKHYTHQSMFWSDLGPHLGYEAIGIIDSSLQTVGVFCEDAVRDAGEEAGEGLEGEAEAAGKRFERGVVFYVRERRVVGVLLWNLFNRMHVARQVLAQGEFEDLVEVAKLFSLHEDDELAEAQGAQDAAA